MPETFIWADDSGTVRVAWDERDAFTAYNVATGEPFAEFTAVGACCYEEARARCARWWENHLRMQVKRGSSR